MKSICWPTHRKPRKPETYQWVWHFGLILTQTVNGLYLKIDKSGIFVKIIIMAEERS